MQAHVGIEFIECTKDTIHQLPVILFSKPPIWMNLFDHFFLTYQQTNTHIQFLVCLIWLMSDSLVAILTSHIRVCHCIDKLISSLLPAYALHHNSASLNTDAIQLQISAPAADKILQTFPLQSPCVVQTEEQIGHDVCNILLLVLIHANRMMLSQSHSWGKPTLTMMCFTVWCINHYQ